MTERDHGAAVAEDPDEQRQRRQHASLDAAPELFDGASDPDAV